MLKSKVGLHIYLFFLFQLIGWIAIAYMGHDSLFLFINGAANESFLPAFFWIMTLFGEWPLVVFTLLFVLIKHNKHLLQVIILFSSCGVLTYLLKFKLFGKIPRPASYFIDQSELYLSPYLSTNYWYSFPSGHTFMAFTGFFFLAYLIKNKWLKICCFLLAALVGISRIYNGQHFPEDVLWGSLLGVILSYLIYTFVPKNNLKIKGKIKQQ